MNIYIQEVFNRLSEIESSQADAIIKAGEQIAKAISMNQLLYVYGAGGHTSLIVGEMFFRIGGLANIYPIVEYGLTAFSSARRFLELECSDGIGASLINSSGINEGETILIFHTIGVNASCISAAERAHEKGAYVIGIASDEWQKLTPYTSPIRDKSTKNLKDIADLYINDCNTVDDANILLPGMDSKICSLSGIGAFAIAHMIELEAVKHCLNQGISPPIWSNANTPEGVKKNEMLLNKYRTRIPFL